MNWQTATLPRIKRPAIPTTSPTIGMAHAQEKPSTTHVRLGLQAAAHCVDWLNQQGFIVLGVQIGKRNPKIEIAPSRHCLSLEGAIYLTERSINQPTRRGWVARRFDCEIRWSETL